MKTRTILFLILGFTTTPLLAQVPVEEIFQPKDILVNAGIGIPSRQLTPLGNPEGFSIPVVLQAEFGIHEYFAVGPVVGLSYFPITSNGVRYSSQIINIGARTTFHGTKILDYYTEGNYSLENIDLYALFVPGIEVFSVVNSAGNPRLEPTFRLRLGIGGGLRYYFKPNLGIFVEGVAGFQSLVTAGLTVKLNKL